MTFEQILEKLNIAGLDGTGMVDAYCSLNKDKTLRLRAQAAPPGTVWTANVNEGGAMYKRYLDIPGTCFSDEAYIDGERDRRYVAVYMQKGGVK